MSEAKRRLLAARAMSDVAAAQTVAVVASAERRGVFHALTANPIAARDVGEACGIAERETAAILTTLAASGYVHVDENGRYSLSKEQQALFVNAEDPLFLGTAFALAASVAAGDAVGTEEAIARTSRAKYPSIVERRWSAILTAARSLAELGCGRGGTIGALGRRFPSLQVTGIDTNGDAIARARHDFPDAQFTWIAGDASALAREAFDAVLTLEAVHEFDDPDGVASSVSAALRPGGVWLVIEPCKPAIADEFSLRYLGSLGALHCLRGAGGRSRLGPLATREQYEDVMRRAGFATITISEEGPLHIAIECRRP